MKTPDEEDPEPDTELGENERSGTRYIVRSRLHGMPSGLLPIEQPVSWADNGPVVRIFTLKAEKAESGAASSPGSPPKGSVEVWHPVDSLHNEPEDGEHFHHGEMDRLRELAGRLERLNTELAEQALTEANAKKQLAAHLSIEKRRIKLTTAWQRIPKVLKDLWKAVISRSKKPEVQKQPAHAAPDFLASQALLRRCYADINYEQDGRVKHLTLGLFFITFLAVLLVQIYEFWTKAEGTHGHRIDPVRVGLFFSALAAFGCGWIWYRMHRRRDTLDLQNHSRALAEAQRVQFYTAAAGLPFSVSSAYPKRSRWELAWLRAAISSTAFPYEEAVGAYDRLTLEERKNRLTGVRHSWVGEQVKFFTEKTHEFQQRRHLFHTLGTMLLIAGFVLILANFAAHTLHADEQMHAISGRFGCWPLILWLVAAISFWTCQQWIEAKAWKADRRFKKDEDDDEEPLQETPPVSGNNGEVAQVRWIPWHNRLYHFTHHWAFKWGLGLTLGLAAVCSIWGCHGGWDWFPPALKFSSICKNLLLTSGGLLHAWCVVKFFNENINRYSSMERLYRSAKARIAPLLKKGRPFGPKDEAIIRETLECLAREHLQENADWLQMHRMKPMEPLLPVG